MSYSRSKKDTDTEKKLQAIRTQLYGKDREISSGNTFKFKAVDFPKTLSPEKPLKEDTVYLRQDLLRTAILATFALTAQILLYLIMQNGFKV